MQTPTVKPLQALPAPEPPCSLTVFTARPIPAPATSFVPGGELGPRLLMPARPHPSGVSRNGTVLCRRVVRTRLCADRLPRAQPRGGGEGILGRKGNRPSRYLQGFFLQ